MILKCLRALTSPMASEHGTHSDIFLTAPGELLSIPVHACREQNNPKCQCRRVFVGISTGNPTTLARVGVCTQEEMERDCDLSQDIIRSYDELLDEDGILLHDPQGLSYAIRQFPVGAIVRVDRTNEAITLLDTWPVAV